MNKKQKASLIAIFIFAPGGTVIAPCLWIIDLWRNRKRGNREPTPPAK